MNTTPVVATFVCPAVHCVTMYVRSIRRFYCVTRVKNEWKGLPVKGLEACLGNLPRSDEDCPTCEQP